MSDFEDDITEMPDPASTSATLPASCVPEDFVSLAPSRCCVYLPCKSLWPNASIDDRFGPVPLLKPDGSPVLNNRGKVVTIPRRRPKVACPTCLADLLLLPRGHPPLPPF